MTCAASWRRISSPSGVSRVMTATAASWSTTVARSRGLPSTRIAIAALARSGPIAAAISLPVAGCGNSRRLPSGRVTARGPRTAAGPSGAGDCKLSWDCSLIAPYAPSSSAVQTGQAGHKKPRPVAGGVVRVEALQLDQRAQPPGAPPSRVLVVVTTRIRSVALMSRISRPSASASSRVRDPTPRPRAVARCLPGRFKSLIADLSSLIGRFNSLFAAVGNLHFSVRNIDSLAGRLRPPDGAERAISVFLPINQGTGPQATYPAVSPLFVLGTIELGRCG